MSHQHQNHSHEEQSERTCGQVCAHEDVHDHTHNETHEHSHYHKHPHEHEGCCTSTVPIPVSANKSILKKAVPQGSQRSQWYIAAMDCPVEENMIRKKLAGISEVHEMEFNLIQRVLTVIHAEKMHHLIVNAVAELNMKAVPVSAGEEAEFEPDTQKQRRTLLLAIGGLLLALVAELMHYMEYPMIFSAIPSLAAIAMCGLSTYKKGWIAIRHFELNINALMSIAVTGAVFIGQWPEAAMVMALFTISELIEERSLDRARMAIRSLLQLAPENMTVQQADGSWQEVEPKDVTVGSLARVRPGQRIALDGIITQGNTSIDQSSVTGESLPVEKAPGDAVFAGTLNTSGEFQFEVTSTTKNSTLARIIHVVEEAQSERAPTQRFIDQFARYYTPAVVGIAFLVALLPPLFMSTPWIDSIYKALVILVIACPCALVISTPVTIVSGLTAASRRGLLIKGGVYLENARHLRWVALDKTGTITYGKPVQTNMHVFVPVANGVPSAQAIAASLASRSDHPVSMAIAQEAEKNNVALVDVENFEAVSGQGTRGTIQGTRYQLGNLRMSQQLGLLTTMVEEQITAMEKKGQTVVALSSDQVILALFAVSDTIKPESKQAIEELHSMGVHTLMLSGDNAHTVQIIAKQAGIDEALGEQLPEDKLKAIDAKKEALKAQNNQGMIGMVGDGINDAPALARADIGFAMGLMGTDTAMETADVAIMDDNLRKIPELIRLSKRTHALLIQNISLALGIKAVFLGLTLIGLGTMWMAVFADVGTSLLVVFNGLRILRS